MGMFSKYRSFVHTSTLLDPNGLNLLFNLFIMKESVEKYLSSFTFSKTIAIEHLSTSTTLIMCQIILLIISNIHIQEHGLQFEGGFIVATKLAITITMKKEACIVNFN
jgi:hypothetical protein